MLYTQLRENQQALNYFQQALKVSREIGSPQDEQVALTNIGWLLNEASEFQQSLESFHQALNIAQEIGDRPAEATILNNIGYAYQGQGENAQAMVYYKKSIDILETIQGDIQVEELKSSFASQQTTVYGNLIGLLWDDG